MRLRDRSHSVGELTDRLAEFKAQIRDWKDEFTVESPNHLRATLAEDDLSPEEGPRRREIARGWEHLQLTVTPIRGSTQGGIKTKTTQTLA